MREIKFRVWVNKRKKYLQKDESYVLPVINQGKLLVGIDYNNKMFMGDVLEQYTGLKDKNSVEIYEGDEMNYGVYNVVVYWNNKKVGYYMKFKDGLSKQLNYRLNDFEVIGNIHES